MRVSSHALGELLIVQEGEDLEPVVAGSFTSVEEYSRFKFGDGEVGTKYGSMLGSLALERECELAEVEDVYVASSAYRVAPPASESLLAPFIDSAQMVVESTGLPTTVNRFKIGKIAMATDNYAAMTFEQRSRTLQGDLILPEGLDLQGRRVIILDDIRVTGLRQAALEHLLGAAGVEQASFYYVLDVPDGKQHPQTEAIINMRSVRSIDDVIELAMQPGFIPNVRLCKFILSQDIAALDRFCAVVPQEVADTVLRYIEADNLREVIKAIP